MRDDKKRSVVLGLGRYWNGDGDVLRRYVRGEVADLNDEVLGRLKRVVVLVGGVCDMLEETAKRGMMRGGGRRIGPRVREVNSKASSASLLLTC